MSTSETTTDHDKIRNWVEQPKGRPAIVKGTEGKDNEGILRIEFRPQVSPHFWLRAKSDRANYAWQSQLRCLSLWSATCVYTAPCLASRRHVCLFVSVSSS